MVLTGSVIATYCLAFLLHIKRHYVGNFQVPLSLVIVEEHLDGNK